MALGGSFFILFYFLLFPFYMGSSHCRSCPHRGPKLFKPAEVRSYNAHRSTNHIHTYLDISISAKVREKESSGEGVCVCDGSQIPLQNDQFVFLNVMGDGSFVSQDQVVCETRVSRSVQMDDVKNTRTTMAFFVSFSRPLSVCASSMHTKVVPSAPSWLECLDKNPSNALLIPRVTIHVPFLTPHQVWDSC